MTIVVCAASPDGIVLAADSRTTSSDDRRSRVVTDHAQKVFAIHRFGVATYGLASLGSRNIRGLMDEFIASTTLGATLGVDTFCERLGAFFHQRLTTLLDSWGQTLDPDLSPLSFIVAGYDRSGIGQVRDVLLVRDGPMVREAEADTARLGILWRGHTEMIRWLVDGVDRDGARRSKITIPHELDAELGSLEFRLQYPRTLQDALDCATFFIRTTVDMQRFSDGTYAAPGSFPTCGGLVQGLAVQSSGIAWITRPGTLKVALAGKAEGAFD
jgi:hypothetical protein